MHWIDWLIVLGAFAGLAFTAYTTKQYVRGIADFLAANRCAGRYLLTLADGMAGLGAIGIVATFQQFYAGGFGAAWWGGIMGPIMLLLPLTGFIIYRFRESRVMTIAEFYERRYSRRFRIFAGIMAFVAGIINYGVFPQVTGLFFIYFCGIPVYIWEIAGLEINVTLGIVMGILLLTALAITFRGGQIAIMITDFLQAQFVNVVFLIILFVLLMKFGLGDAISTLKTAEEGKSMINPFKQGSLPDFNIFFYLIMAFNVVYSYMAWQGNQGYNCSAKTPHDAKMARILAAWRYGATWTVIALLAVFSWVLMNSPEFTQQAAITQDAISALGDEGLERQLTVPLALRQVLPVGVFGLFVAAMLAAAISTDDTYLHSWGSIFIQDVYLPLKGKRLEPGQHMKLLRRAIFGVAVFVWLFSMIFPLRDYIFMYWAITGAIYVGGAGSVIIGGFYWKRATTAGAWAGMIVGSTLAFTGVMMINVVWPDILPGLREAYPDLAWLQALPESFWVNGTDMMFIASAAAIISYVGVSLMTKPDPNFCMDKLLHRGEYAIEGEHRYVAPQRKGFLWLLGVDDEYTKFDKFVAISLFAWTMFWFAVFIAGTIYALSVDTTDDFWANYWIFSQGAYILVGIVTVVWFLWGGFRDLGELFRDLKRKKVDLSDDGMVIDEAEKGPAASSEGEKTSGAEKEERVGVPLGD